MSRIVIVILVYNFYKLIDINTFKGIFRSLALILYKSLSGRGADLLSPVYRSRFVICLTLHAFGTSASRAAMAN
jgi:hypothetical protein